MLADRALVRDEQAAIEARLRGWIADPEVDVVISTGGTGLTGRDVTVEAHEAVYEKAIAGLRDAVHDDLLRRRSAPRRSRAAPAPGWPAAPTSSRCRARRGPAGDAWDGILAAQLDARHRPCNFVEIMPRLEEHQRRK